MIKSFQVVFFLCICSFSIQATGMGPSIVGPLNQGTLGSGNSQTSDFCDLNRRMLENAAYFLEQAVSLEDEDRISYWHNSFQYWSGAMIDEGCEF